MGDTPALPWYLRETRTMGGAGVAACFVVVTGLFLTAGFTVQILQFFLPLTVVLPSAWTSQARAAGLTGRGTRSPNIWLQLSACVVGANYVIVLMLVGSAVITAVVLHNWTDQVDVVGYVSGMLVLVGLPRVWGRRRGVRLKAVIEEQTLREQQRRDREHQRLARDRELAQQQWAKERDLEMQRLTRQRELEQERLTRDRDARRRLAEQALDEEQRAKAAASAWSGAQRRTRAAALLDQIEQHSAGQLHRVSGPELSAELSWNAGELSFVANHLAIRGLVQVWPVFTREHLQALGIRSFSGYAHGVGVSYAMITQKGFEHMDRENHSQGNNFGGNLLINSIINVGDGNQAVAGSPGASTWAVSEERAVEQLKVLIGEYRTALDTEQVDEDTRASAVFDLDSLERQLDRRPLSKPVIAQLLSSLRSVAEGVVGNSAFAGLAAWLAS